MSPNTMFALITHNVRNDWWPARPGAMFQGSARMRNGPTRPRGAREISDYTILRRVL
jgi:hypothetical protein